MQKIRTLLFKKKMIHEKCLQQGLKCRCGMQPSKKFRRFKLNRRLVKTFQLSAVLVRSSTTSKRLPSLDSQVLITIQLHYECNIYVDDMTCYNSDVRMKSNIPRCTCFASNRYQIEAIKFPSAEQRNREWNYFYDSRMRNL